MWYIFLVVQELIQTRFDFIKKCQADPKLKKTIDWNLLVKKTYDLHDDICLETLYTMQVRIIIIKCLLQFI